MCIRDRVNCLTKYKNLSFVICQVRGVHRYTTLHTRFHYNVIVPLFTCLLVHPPLRHFNCPLTTCAIKIIHCVCVVFLCVCARACVYTSLRANSIRSDFLYSINILLTHVQNKNKSSPCTVLPS